MAMFSFLFRYFLQKNFFLLLFLALGDEFHLSFNFLNITLIDSLVVSSSISGRESGGEGAKMNLVNKSSAFWIVFSTYR